jgi:AraC family transcriptional regulator
MAIMSSIETSGAGKTSSTASSIRVAARNCVCSRADVVVAQTSPQRIDFSRSLAIRSEGRDDLVVSHMFRSRPGHGMTEPHARSDAYTACVHLDKFTSYDVWCDERHESTHPLDEGTIHINDMRHIWRADIRSAFHVVNFHIPQQALDEIADEYGVSRIDGLQCPMNRRHVDNVFRNLALAMLPALAHPDQANKLFADYASRAVRIYLATTYGSLRYHAIVDRGGLAPWQERRAKELLRENLAANVSLAELAGACRLSASRFSQAFKQTVGCPPHQWLISQRVERAKQLMLNTDQSLAEIALALGFSDQSHFTRVFSRWVKASPSAWRRAQGI